MSTSVHEFRPKPAETEKITQPASKSVPTSTAANVKYRILGAVLGGDY